MLLVAVANELLLDLVENELLFRQPLSVLTLASAARSNHQKEY
jgi:hypothetical protein